MFKRSFVSFMAIVMCASALFISPSTRVEAQGESKGQLNGQLDNLTNQYNDLKKQKDALQSKIDNAKNAKQKQIAIKNQINGQINITRSEINVLTQRIAVLEENMTQKENDIKKKQGLIEENYKMFLNRVRALYMAGNSSALEIILQAKSYRSALIKAKVMESIAEHDQDLIDRLLKEKKDIENAVEELAKDKIDLDSSKKDLDGKKSTLDKQLNQTNKEIQDIATLEKNYFANKAELDKQEKQIQNEMDNIYSQLDPTYDQFVGGKFGWPVPGYTYISSKYGWRFNGTNFHTGIDITGGAVYGKSIVASNTGTVVYKRENFVPGKGYGRYLIVDHGGGYTTLYGHTSKIVVNVGDKVVRGQKIAEVGSTGWSTGPHLHFEVRVNGKAQNPLSYL